MRILLPSIYILADFLESKSYKYREISEMYTQLKAFIPKMCNLFCKEIPDFKKHCMKRVTHCFLQGLGNFKKENTQASYIIAQIPLKSKSLEFNPYLSTKARKTINLNPTSTHFQQLSPFCLIARR